MNKKKVILIVVGVVLLGVAIFGVNYAINFSYYEEIMPTVKIEDVDISSVNDGVYTGSFDAKIISATAEVKVENGMITDILLVKHKYERGGSAEAIVDTILMEQSLDVDTVSGATNSSKTILKAVENALNNEVDK